MQPSLSIPSLSPRHLPIPLNSRGLMNLETSLSPVVSGLPTMTLPPLGRNYYEYAGIFSFIDVLLLRARQAEVQSEK